VICAFIRENKTRFGVEPICRVLSEHGCKIAPSTYYAHLQRLAAPATRTVSDAVLGEQIRALRTRTNQAGEVVAAPESLYGYRKTWRVLRAQGVQVARCTVARVMRTNGWSGTTRRRKVRTTIPGKNGLRAGDLLNRHFSAPRPDHTWTADSTYVRTWAGFVYVAFVVDVYAQPIVGWHAARTKHTDLVLHALRMGTWTRAHQGRPVTGGVIHHSDAGSQYVSVRYVEHLALQGPDPVGGHRRGRVRQRSDGGDRGPVQGRVHRHDRVPPRVLEDAHRRRVRHRRAGRVVQQPSRPLHPRLPHTRGRRRDLLRSNPGWTAGNRQQLNSPTNPGRFTPHSPTLDPANQGWVEHKGAEATARQRTAAGCDGLITDRNDTYPKLGILSAKHRSAL
jgi:putative transposase